MLPVQDVIPSRTTPWATLGLISLIAGMLIIELGLPELSVRRLIVSYGLVPAHLSWPTVLTATFLHYGVLDASANMLTLWLFGDNVEDRLGHARFLALFLAGAVAAALTASWLADPGLTPLIGAAGPIGAVVGAHLVLLPKSQVLMLVPVWRGLDLVEIPTALVVPAWVLLTGLLPGAEGGPWAALSLTLGLQVSGFLTGAALARLLARPERLNCAWWNDLAGQPPERRRTSRETSASSASSASN